MVYNLEPEADRVERLVRTGEAGHHCRPEMIEWILSLCPVPIYAVDRVGGEIEPIDTGSILHTWETDSVKTPVDLGFIKAMRRTDLPAGAFFVLVFPREGPGQGMYFWRLCLPTNN
jgi:hypothetical protein